MFCMDKLKNISGAKFGCYIILPVFLFGCSAGSNTPSVSESSVASEPPSASASAEPNLLVGDFDVEAKKYTVTVDEMIQSKNGLIHPTFQINFDVNLHRDNMNYTGYYIDGIGGLLDSTYIDEDCLLYFPKAFADKPVYKENHQILTFPVEFGFIPDISSEPDLTNCKMYRCNIDYFTRKDYMVVLNLFDLLGEYEKK